MRKLYFKKLLSLLMVILMVFPAIVSASSDNLKIKFVYFQDESGNMVLVNYESAINQSLEGNHILYNAIKEYVGIAESKGRKIYLETNTGKILDYRLAMIDNLFRLQDIIGKEKYEVNRMIVYTHELKIVNGEARIVDKQDPPEPDPLELVGITPVNNITVEIGTTEEAAKALLSQTTTIKDNKNGIHKVNLDWTIGNYNGTVEGKYTAIGTFKLPEGINNSRGIELEVKATITVYAPVVEPDWPIEVEDVFVGKSQITNNTYANIKIKEEYVSAVEAVYVDNILANKMEDEPSQWRIQVEEGTIVEDLKGRIKVTVEEIPLPEFAVVIDKDKYNIDEVINLTGIISKESIELKNIDITLKVEGEDGIILVEQLMTDNDGKFSYKFKMPTDLIEGGYRIVIKGNEPINKVIEINFMISK